MKTKRIIFALIVIVIGIVCFISGWKIKDIQCEKTILNELFDCEIEIDSLKTIQYLRRDEQLPYNGMLKNEILRKLPKEKWHSIDTLFDDGKVFSWHWLYNPYKERIEGTQDTIIIDTYYWEIPYHDRPNLYIVFEKKGEQWIGATCVQWYPDSLYFSPAKTEHK
jgi:hypothetical protein